MTEITVERSSDVIAVEINSIKDQTRKMVLHNSIEIGKRLVEAKAIVSHGEWGNWLEESVDYSQSTANNLMKIYEEYGDGQAALFGGDANSETIASLPYTKALALLNIPSYEREEFVEENNVHDLSTRQLQEVIKEKKELEQKLEIYEEEAEVHNELSKQVDNYKQHIDILESKLEKAESNNDEELIKKLEQEKKESNAKLKEHSKKIKELEAELKKKPVEATQVVERVPDDVKAELEDLRKQVENNSSDEAEVKFKYQFDALVNSFRYLLQSLDNVQDEGTKGKYKDAVTQLMEKMSETLK